MTRMAFLASGLLLAAIAPPTAAQTATDVRAPAGFAPVQAPCVRQTDGSCAPVSATTPLPIAAGPLAAASSVAQSGSVTSSGTAPTSGTAAFAGGAATIGPLAPQLGREVRVVLRGTWSGTFAIGTSVDACATINPLTIAGQTWGSFTANANEAVDVPTLAGVGYCATATVTSGTLNYTVRQ